jgi:nitroreductase
MSLSINPRKDSGDATSVLESLLAGRRSCRSFLNQQVPLETIERLVSLAQRSASWCNIQPWQLVVTKGDGTERFRAAMTAWAHEGEKAHDFAEPVQYRGVYRDRRRECALRLYESVGVTWGDRTASARQASENFRFFGAPHVAIITSPLEYGAYGALDAGIFIGNFLLAAQALGLGAVPQAAISAYSRQIREYFEIPDDRGVLGGISFGFANAGHPVNSFRTSRAEISEVVSWVES